MQFGCVRDQIAVGEDGLVGKWTHNRLATLSHPILLDPRAKVWSFVKESVGFVCPMDLIAFREGKPGESQRERQTSLSVKLAVELPLVEVRFACGCAQAQDLAIRLAFQGFVHRAIIGIIDDANIGQIGEHKRHVLSHHTRVA